MKEPYFSRVNSLRKLMEEASIDAYMIVTDDFHASEYVSEYFCCRAYISGFDGSAGTLIVTAKEACLWTDGRYFIQARDQLEGTGITLMKMGEPGVPRITEWLKEKLADGNCLGYDGRTINAGMADAIKQALRGKNIRFAEEQDLVDRIWPDRPAFPHAPIWFLDERYSGKASSEKLADLRAELKKAGADWHLLASLDDIAWLYNYRGDDVEHNPVAMAYTLVSADHAILYIAPDAVSESERKRLAADGVTLRPYLQVYEDLKVLSGKLLLDKNTVNVALLAVLPAAVELLNRANPTTLPKAVKNAVEMENERLAHVKDGVSMTKLIFWLKHLRDSEDFKAGRITELTVSRKLLEIRRSLPDFLQESFPSIMATGAHGAIVHYEPTEETDVPLADNNYLLMDTGSHFLQGSTDITRTTSIGSVTEEMKLHYTAVLRGHLDLGMAYFRDGVTGDNLDYLARNPLWELGLDFNHGTGHGVGYLLNVHEGPQNISLRSRGGACKFREGMLTSDEPGLYLEGRYGIRIENLTLTVPAAETEYGRFLRFEHVTMVPYDRASILPELLTERERKALNEYHAKVYETLLPWLTEEEAAWLKEETAEI